MEIQQYASAGHGRQRDGGGVRMSETSVVTLSSHRSLQSVSNPGVEFVIGRMTFGRRIELMRLVRDLATRLEFFEAGKDAGNKMEASLLGAEIDRLYVEWGLETLSGLEIDG